MGLNIHIDPNEVIQLVPSASLDRANSAIGTAIALLEQAYKNITIDYALLHEIAVYAASHIAFICSDGAISQYPVVSESIMDAKVTYSVPDQTKIIGSFRSTRLGAMALMLDITGILQNIGSQPPMFGVI